MAETFGAWVKFNEHHISRRLFLPPVVRHLATRLKGNSSLSGGRSILHQRWQKDPPNIRVSFSLREHLSRSRSIPQPAVLADRRSLRNTVRGQPMKRAADGTPAARDLKSYRARMGIAPCVVVKNAKDVMTSFCGTTASRVFFEYPDESQKLMHAAVVTACDGYVFFEDMDVDCYSSALKVPFKEYRSQETPHVYLHCNVPSAFDIEAKMLGAKVPCRSVLAVAKQFFGSELGIVRDACGFSWTLATKSEEAVEVQPEPAVRASLSVPDVDAYLDCHWVGSLDIYVF